VNKVESGRGEGWKFIDMAIATVGAAMAMFQETFLKNQSHLLKYLKNLSS
jgi:hypothetical protein